MKAFIHHFKKINLKALALQINHLEVPMRLGGAIKSLGLVLSGVSSEITSFSSLIMVRMDLLDSSFGNGGIISLLNQPAAYVFLENYLSFVRQCGYTQIYELI